MRFGLRLSRSGQLKLRLAEGTKQGVTKQLFSNRKRLMAEGARHLQVTHTWSFLIWGDRSASFTPPVVPPVSV